MAPDTPPSAPAARPGSRHAAWGWVFIAPWLAGFALFTAGPLVWSAWLSLCHSDLRTTTFAGGANYARIAAHDPAFWTALWNTVFYVSFAVPLGLTGSLLLAVLLNQNLRGIAIFRTAFYLPTLVPGVASALLWMMLLNTDFGLFNQLLVWLGFGKVPWLSDPAWAKPSLILMSLWGIGGARMLIFLAGLQQIDRQYYEAAEIDGASRWHTFRHITLPLLTPTILFNLILGVIGGFMVFTQALILTGGGPGESTLFCMLYIFRQAFEQSRFGYACALAWVLFAILFTLTLLQLRSSKRWVHYEGGEA